MASKMLTAREVDSIKPGPKRREVPDGGNGHYLVVNTSGKKAWAFRYRFGTRTRRLTLGHYPLMRLADAREATRDAAQKLAYGIDPGAPERADDDTEQPILTVESVGRDFIERYARPRHKTWHETERLLERHLYPVLGERDIASVTRRDIIDILDRTAATGAKLLPNRVLAGIRKFFNWAVDRDLIAVAPTAGIRPPARETPRDRMLSDDEIAAFLVACDRLGYPFGDIFFLLLLTGQRRGEVAEARWEEIDFTAAEWRLPAERTKSARAHVVPLPPQALTVLERIRQRHEQRAGPDQPLPSPFVFPSRSQPNHAPSGFPKAKRMLDRFMLEVLRGWAGDDPRNASRVTMKPFRLHDLRRTAASGMARLGTPIHVTERLLNHTSGATTAGLVAVYQRYEFGPEKRAAIAAWADFLEQIRAQTGDRASHE